MIGVSDIVKLLEQIPVWKRLSALPARVAELEARIAALETEKSSATCPMCGAAMAVTKVEPHPQFGVMGHQQHSLACTACNHTEKRRIVP